MPIQTSPDRTTKISLLLCYATFQPASVVIMIYMYCRIYIPVLKGVGTAVSRKNEKEILPDYQLPKKYQVDTVPYLLTVSYHL